MLTVSIAGCATLTSDAMTPITLSFGDGSSGDCVLTNKRGVWSTTAPATVSVRRSDDALKYQCKTADGCVSQFSCATAVNEKNTILHAQTAYTHQKSGDWKAARIEWARAIVNANLGEMDDKVRAIFYYEYGRSLGVTCIFDVAEFFLNKALELDKKTGEPLYLSLTELSRLYLDQNKFEQATKYLEKSFFELDKKSREKETPIEYANMLDEYALALSKIGEKAKSEGAKIRAIKLRKENPKGYLITERTPYGTQCEYPLLTQNGHLN